MQNQHYRSTDHFGRSPWPTVVIGQLHVRHDVADAQCHRVGLMARTIEGLAADRGMAMNRPKFSRRGDAGVIDNRLRATKDRIVEPVVARMPRAFTPGRLTASSLVFCVGAALLAASGWRWWSVAAWLVGRVLDGLDGAVARRQGTQSDLGGYLDLIADSIGYAAIPIGIAASRGGTASWVACAGLLGSFYLNTISWTLLAAIAEKRNAGAAARGERTTIYMPSGLIEGAETIVLFTVMLALPAQAEALFLAMATLVTLTIGQRVLWAVRSL